MLRLFSLKFFLTQSKIKMDGLGGIVYILTARVHIMDKIQRYNQGQLVHAFLIVWALCNCRLKFLFCLQVQINAFGQKLTLHCLQYTNTFIFSRAVHILHYCKLKKLQSIRVHAIDWRFRGKTAQILGVIRREMNGYWCF